MNDALQVAIAKIIAKDLPELATGSYEIDQTVTLHVKGTVVVEVVAEPVSEAVAA